MINVFPEIKPELKGRYSEEVLPLKTIDIHQIAGSAVAEITYFLLSSHFLYVEFYDGLRAYNARITHLAQRPNSDGRFLYYVDRWKIDPIVLVSMIINNAPFEDKRVWN